MRNIIAALLILAGTIGFVISQTSYAFATKPSGNYTINTCNMPDTMWNYCASGGTLSCTGTTQC